MRLHQYWKRIMSESQVAASELRQLLLGENYIAKVAQRAPAGLRLRTPVELESTLQAILRRHEPARDLYVFCYGSLMWNPALEHSGQFKARIHGRHRSFCLRNLIGRGAPERPGLMLALDRGGSCNGTILRIPASKVEDELRLLWRREMVWGSYEACWVTAWAGADPVEAVTFVVRRSHERYVGDLSPQQAARLINTGAGSLGTCRAYFDSTLQKLRELGIRDRRMEHLDAIVRSA
jgi:glutathione-specific gamma-glutamylcyclotransferase